MNEEAFADLERTARKIRERDEREKALAAIAEARDLDARMNDHLRTSFGGGQPALARRRKPRPQGYWGGVRQRLSRMEPWGERPFQGYRLLDYVKLLLGVVALIGLGISLLYLALSIAGWRVHGLTPNVLALLVKWGGLTLVSSTVLVLSARRSARKRAAVRADDVKRRFARRKWLFNLSTVALIILTAGCVGWLSSKGVEFPGEGWVVAGGFFGGFYFLGSRFWRCPSCETKLPFMEKRRSSASYRRCPHCHAALQ